FNGGSGGGKPQRAGKAAGQARFHRRATEAEAEAPVHTALTQREREVLEQVASGSSNRQIAENFGLSEHTVKNHLKNILQKLHLDNRVQLTRYALEKGLVQE